MLADGLAEVLNSAVSSAGLLFASLAGDDGLAPPAAAAGPPNLIASFGFHVWSCGRLVPGEVCLAEPVGFSAAGDGADLSVGLAAGFLGVDDDPGD